MQIKGAAPFDKLLIYALRVLSYKSYQMGWPGAIQVEVFLLSGGFIAVTCLS